MRVTIVGCGGSQGVPSSTGDWGLCDPTDPRNRRRRPSVLIETETSEGAPRTLLIDTPPDLREQLIDAGVRRIDAVLYTHGHADHMHGVDDLRPFVLASKAPIPVYATAKPLNDLRERFAYTVTPSAKNPYPPMMIPFEVDGPFDAAGIPVIPFAQDHGFGPSTGFRIGDFAYSIDVKRLDEAAFAVLDGITHWVVDCQQIEPHPSHSHLAQTLAWIERVGPKHSFLTHMGSRLDYSSLTALLPADVEPGVDGLRFEIP
jgi:phosphoribosyl 1,2-cyclic phosphate phosphodiesterase